MDKEAGDGQAKAVNLGSQGAGEVRLQLQVVQRRGQMTFVLVTSAALCVYGAIWWSSIKLMGRMA